MKSFIIFKKIKAYSKELAGSKAAVDSVNTTR